MTVVFPISRTCKEIEICLDGHVSSTFFDFQGIFT